MRTKENMVDVVNRLLNEDLTEQFQQKEDLMDYGGITIENSKGEYVALQSVIFRWELHYVITGYKFLLVKD